MGKIIRDVVLISKDTGKKTLITELDSSLTAKEFLDEFAESISLPNRINDILIRKLTYYQFDSYETLDSAEIEDGEILIASVGFRGGGGVLVRSMRDIQLVEGMLRHSNEMFDPNMGYANGLFAVFLYTNEDIMLASYIKDNLGSLHEMSGRDCTFFVIEEPAPEWRMDIGKYLGTLAEDYYDAIEIQLEGNIFKPYEKEKAYKIAKYFGVMPKQFPCIVLFSNLRSYEALVIELSRFVGNLNNDEGVYSKFFRVLFSNVQEANLLGVNKSLKKLSRLMKKEEKRKNQKAFPKL